MYKHAPDCNKLIAVIMSICLVIVSMPSQVSAQNFLAPPSVVDTGKSLINTLQDPSSEKQSMPPLRWGMRKSRIPLLKWASIITFGSSIISFFNDNLL
ncbi:MAG: hypothetical protein ABII23_06830 [bacterium]